MLQRYAYLWAEKWCVAGIHCFPSSVLRDCQGAEWAKGLRRTIPSVFCSATVCECVDARALEDWAELTCRPRHHCPTSMFENRREGRSRLMLIGLTFILYPCCSGATLDVSAEGWVWYCSWKQCCGAGAVIKLPPGAEAVTSKKRIRLRILTIFYRHDRTL